MSLGPGFEHKLERAAAVGVPMAYSVTSMADMCVDEVEEKRATFYGDASHKKRREPSLTAVTARLL